MNGDRQAASRHLKRNSPFREGNNVGIPTIAPNGQDGRGCCPRALTKINHMHLRKITRIQARTRCLRPGHFGAGIRHLAAGSISEQSEKIILAGHKPLINQMKATSVAVTAMAMACSVVTTSLAADNSKGAEGSETGRLGDCRMESGLPADSLLDF